VLGHRHTGAGNDKSRAGGNVVGARSVTAGADNIDRALRGIDLGHPAAHGADRAGYLVDALAAHAQRHQKAANLAGGRLAGHDDIKGVNGLLAGELLPCGRLGNEAFHIGHQAASRRRPLRALKAAAISRKFFRMR
jgi:hypothetical protein